MVENRFEKVQKLIMARTEETSRTLEDKNAQLDTLLKAHLPLITCDCGAEILLVPDLRAMNLAIEAHVAYHRKNRMTLPGRVNTSVNISQLLSQLTLIKMSEIKRT
jgi:hypothetical protein